MIPIIDSKKCDGCEDCMEVCPPEAITIVDEKAQINEVLCEECGVCVPECSKEAISLPDN